MSGPDLDRSGGGWQGPVFDHDIGNAVEILLVVRNQSHSERDCMGGDLRVVGAGPTGCRSLNPPERPCCIFVERHDTDRGENGHGIASCQVRTAALRKPDFKLTQRDRRHDEIAGFAPVQAPIQVFAATENRIPAPANLVQLAQCISGVRTDRQLTLEMPGCR